MSDTSITVIYHAMSLTILYCMCSNQTLNKFPNEENLC